MARKKPPKIVKEFDVTADINNSTFTDYYKRLQLLALSMFKWENLPETMNARFLEECLYFRGQAAFCNDENLGFINLNCVPSNTLNIYNESTEYNCYSNGYSKNYQLDENMVFVRNNYLRIPTDYTIQLFAYRLYECERTMDVNVKSQKTPVIILCDDEERLSMQNLYQKYDGNIPVIYGSKDIDLKNFTVLKTDAPFVTDKLIDYKKNVWNEALAFLGINNVAHEKRERLIKDEVNANNEQIELSAQTMLSTRQDACEKFNKMFNKNISVRLRTYDEIMNRGDNNNGTIYNGTQNPD